MSDVWAARGDRAGEGTPWPPPYTGGKKWRGAARIATTYRVMAGECRAKASAELARAIRGDGKGWFGVPSARRELHVAAEFSTIAAGLDLAAAGDR